MTVDLDGDTREALELRNVLDYVSGFASSGAGRRAVIDTRPSGDLAGLLAEHAAVAEAVDHLERVGRLLSGRTPDPSEGLDALTVEGLPVPPEALRDLASSLLAGADLARRMAGLEEGFPLLQELGRGIPDLTALAAPIVRGIGDGGRLEDAASPALRRIRESIARTGERLRRQLESFVHDPAAASVVRDDFVTQRNGRFVIPVRADAPRGVDGIVHAASSSGQTIFVEPLESVPLNNDLVRLGEEEVQETIRVLAGWAGRLRERLPEVRRAVAGLTRADVLQARALFRAEIRGSLPRLSQGGALRVQDVRHPLLDRRLRERGEGCVPISLELDPHDRVLVLSGPNTGGKTVALKTVGLAVLMAQCGLPVAAAAMEAPVFRRVRADIGDHQSIDADLSTFSAHVRAVDRFLDDAVVPALYLLDEIGTGTEPGEGSALAQAILERFMALGATVIATTHLGALKTWAFSRPEVGSAALEFDTATLRPTFRVIAGASGASAGLDVAERLGLDEAVVARARELVGGDALAAETTMARLRELTVEMDERVQGLAAERGALEAEREALAERAREESRRRGEEVAGALDRAMREFREAARKELSGIRDAKERARLERAQTRSTARLSAERARSRETLSPERPAPEPAEVAVGARVRIVSLDREGEVAALRGDRVEVHMGSATFTVDRRDLAAPAPSPSLPSRAPRVPRAAAKGPEEPLRPETPLELHLIGKRVEEAFSELDKFLDAIAREGRAEARVVHGHGTGRLREAVRRHLRGHPLVDAFRPGGAGEGGNGATVVTLR